jgi:rod shape-determining protein MreD
LKWPHEEVIHINIYASTLLLISVALIQSTVMPHLTLWGVKPDLMLLVVISWSLLRGAREGIVWGFIGGLCLDLFSGAPFGLSALALLIVSFFSGLGEATVFRTHVILPLATVFFASLIHDLIFLLVLRTLGWSVAWLDSFTRFVLPASLLNVLLIPLIYPAMRWLHRKTGREEMRIANGE